MSKLLLCWYTESVFKQPELEWWNDYYYSSVWFYPIPFLCLLHRTSLEWYHNCNQYWWGNKTTKFLKIVGSNLDKKKFKVKLQHWKGRSSVQEHCGKRYSKQTSAQWIEEEKTCLARSSRSMLPEANKGESGLNLRRTAFQYGNPRCSFSSTCIAMTDCSSLFGTRQQWRVQTKLNLFNF